MISEEARQIRATLVRDPDAPETQARSIAEERLAWEEAAAQTPLPPGVAVTSVRHQTVAGAWIEPADQEDERVVLHLHGGGFSSGSSVTHRDLAARLALACRARVLLPDYRLAPEHPFPAALSDTLNAYQWLLAAGVRPERVVVAGDSAGGALAVAAMLQLRQRGLPLPAAGVLLSPWLDLTVSDPAAESRSGLDPLVTRAGLLAAAQCYLGDADPRDPRASPLYGDVRGLPPLLVQVGSDEVLLGDATRLAEQVRAADGDVTLEVWDGMWHVWHGWAATLPEARQAIDRIGAFVARCLS